MGDSPILARCRIETCLPVEQVAEVIAAEQSSGTFLPVPGETEELKARSRAQVTTITLLEAAEGAGQTRWKGMGIHYAGKARV